MKREIQEFLLRHGLGQFNPREAVDSFVLQGKRGLAGDASSLMMLPAYLKMEGALPAGKPVIVLDAGGTNLRIALAAFSSNGELSLQNERNYPMPGTRGMLSADAFFDALAEIVEPYASESDRIGFCFSFPCEITPELDGRLISFNKEVRVAGAEGRLIGASLAAALRKRGLRGGWEPVILNDTVATMMGGLSQGLRMNCDGYIGLILGTGTNMCYMERCDSVKKLPGLLGQSGRICINMEAGGYDGIPRSDFDTQVDLSSDRPGNHPFEKMVSGAYQGPFVRFMLRAAAQEGLFSASTAQSVTALTELSAADVDAFCRVPDGSSILACICKASDRNVMYELLDCFYDRIAALMACAITGVMELAGQGEGPGSPVCVVADGSAFYKPLLFRPKLDAYMKDISETLYGRYARFVRTEHGNLEGAAIAALMNR